MRSSIFVFYTVRCNTLSMLVSEFTTQSAKLLGLSNSPGFRPSTSLAAMPKSEQPMNKCFGAKPATRFVKSAGSWLAFSAVYKWLLFRS